MMHYTPEFLDAAKEIIKQDLPGAPARELARQAVATVDHIRKNLENFMTPLLSAETPEIMVDLETLALGPEALVLSIGAVAFNVRHCDSVSDFKNPVGTGWGLGSRSFYRVLDIKPQMEKGRIVDAGTIRWWMSQSDAARKVFEIEPWSPYGALDAFRAWVVHQGGKRLWGNPTTFDVPKVESILEDFGIRCPFGYRDYRDVKTLRAVTAPLDKVEHADLVSHHALDDAIYQALEVQRIYRHNPGLRAESDEVKQNGG